MMHASRSLGLDSCDIGNQKFQFQNLEQPLPSPPSTISDNAFEDCHNVTEEQQRQQDQRHQEQCPNKFALQPSNRIYRQEWQRPRDDIIKAPFLYIKSLPSKGVRDVLIDALNLWYCLPRSTLSIVKHVIDLLHTSSLMFDDIEDNSSLRRGRPTTHAVFGVAQTINSSTYVLLSAIQEARKLENQNCASIVTEAVSEMLLGQSMDLNSTYLNRCPTEEEYITMVDNKTGRLFSLLTQLMKAETNETITDHINTFMLLLGRYFQIRDDYLNLVSHEYTDQKGFCEDLEEGKFSYPMVHCWNSAEPLPDLLSTHRTRLQNIFSARSRLYPGTISYEMKLCILDILKDAGSLEFTQLSLENLFARLMEELAVLERFNGSQNPHLRYLLVKLKP